MTYSFSRLTSASDCPYGWYKTYVLEEKGISNSFAQGGTFAHELCEEVAKGNLTPRGASMRFIAEWFEQVSMDYPKFPNSNFDLKEHYYQKIQPFFDRKAYWRGEVVAVEEHIIVDLPDGNKFQGYIDLVLKDKRTSGINLVDHKISKRFSGEDLIKKQRQLYLYGYGYKQIHGVYPEKLIFNFFQEPSNPIVITFNKHYMNEAVQWAMDQIKLIEEMQERGVYEPNFEKLTNDDGTRDFFCQNLCNHRLSCKYVEGDYFKQQPT